MAANPIINNIASLSFNTTGMSDFKGNFINTILLTHSIQICGIQEHFLLEKNLHKLKKYFPQYDVFGLSAFKSNAQIHGGRGSGGLAIL